MTHSFSSLKKALPLILAGLLTCAVIIATMVRIWDTPSMMYWDQSDLKYTFQDPYPIPEQGFPQFWLSGLIQLGGPLDNILLNTLIRMISATIFLLSAGFLGWSVKGQGGLLRFCLWMSLIFTSGFQFIWLSSELLAGAFLMLFLWGFINKLPMNINLFFLAMFGLTKPDLFFVGLLVAAYASFCGNGIYRQKLLHLYFFLGLILLALLPGILQVGIGYLSVDGRSLNSLGQHYAALIHPLQITKGFDDPWKYYGNYVIPTWGMANSTWSLILLNPARYMDFLFLSMAMSLRRLGQALLLFYLPLVILVFKHWQDRTKKNMIFLFALNLIPIFLVAFFHVRYGARFLPLVIFSIFSGLDAVHNPRLRWGIQIGLIVLLVVQVFVLFWPAFSAGYWLVD